MDSTLCVRIPFLLCFLSHAKCCLVYCGSVFIWINLWAWHFWVAVASLYDTLYTKVTLTALKTVKRVYLSYITWDKTCTSFFPKSKAFSWFLFIWHLYFALAEFYSAVLNWTSSNAESWNCKGAIIRWVLIWGKKSMIQCLFCWLQVVNYDGTSFERKLVVKVLLNFWKHDSKKSHTHPCHNCLCGARNACVPQNLVATVSHVFFLLLITFYIFFHSLCNISFSDHASILPPDFGDARRNSGTLWTTLFCPHPFTHQLVNTQDS